MSKATVCDHCGKAIAKDDRHVTVSISDQLILPPKGEQFPTLLSAQLDLHRQCYIDAVLPSLAALHGVPS